MDPRGFPMTLPEFQRVFPDDAACARYLEHLRWPHGFTCMKCGNIGEPYRFAKRRSVVLRCRACQANVSLMAGTVMMGSHMPLSMVLGCLPCGDTDARPVCSAVSAATGHVPLRDSFSDAPQVARRHGAARARRYRIPVSGRSG